MEVTNHLREEASLGKEVKNIRIETIGTEAGARTGIETEAEISIETDLQNSDNLLLLYAN